VHTAVSYFELVIWGKNHFIVGKISMLDQQFALALHGIG
jgi:hypothetical protein